MRTIRVKFFTVPSGVYVRFIYYRAKSSLISFVNYPAQYMYVCQIYFSQNLAIASRANRRFIDKSNYLEI